MKFRSFFTSPFFIRSILVISVSLLLFISSVSYKHTIALKESTELLIHSYKIQVKLEQLLSYIKDAETGQRGYIISRDTIFLQPYNSARQSVEEPYSELRILTSNNVRQYYNLDSLLVLINLRFTLLANSLKLIAEGGDQKRLEENLIKGKRVMDLLRMQTNKMIDLETSYFEDHEKKYAHELYFTPLSTLFLIFFSLIAFVLAFVKINSDVGTLKAANADLRITTESFKQAEEIGNFSSWQWHINSNEYIFSENQYGLLGVEPYSFKPTIDNFLQFVHPDDRHIITRGVSKAVSERKPSEAFFRVIRKDGEMRYWKSIATVTDFNNNPVFIGINSDVTEQHLSNIALENRNRELEQSNAELASFNHIASHDLQEPLRKIQTFISRLNEKDSGSITRNEKEYLDKIQGSAKKMRTLINDLLLFSRAGKAEKVFMESDLNVLLENAQQELMNVIEEKKALIQSVKLPVLNVIPFQIQQLFSNLIGNSLKYSRPGIDPIIKIDCEVVSSGTIPLLKSGKSDYYKISVTDNGLGFEQEYADSLFILFYRLNQKSDFPGSGIGLSICKKIVENHDGYIMAKGNPGTGSTFTFFLPCVTLES
jgi:signal transduction histidine kinase/CHASE3 domain sensor protein